MNKKISIITVCYNDLKGIAKTTESILRQTSYDFEWIIIDGGSSDGSKEHIEKTAIKLKELTNNPLAYYCSEPDKGIYNGMNKGIRKANGKFCLFLNSGDYFCSKKSIERALKKLTDDDIIVFDIFGTTGLPFGLKSFHQHPDKISIGRMLNGGIGHQAAFIKTAILKEEMYDEDYKIVADWKFFFKTLIIDKCKYKHISFPLVCVDTTGVSSKNPSKNQEEKNKAIKEYISPIIITDLIRDYSWKNNLQNSHYDRMILKHMLFFDLIFNSGMRRIDIILKNIKYID